MFFLYNKVTEVFMKKLPIYGMFLILISIMSCANPHDESTGNQVKEYTAIHNFASYNAIGVGIPNIINNRSVRSFYSDEGLKLIGQKRDGTIEVVSFDDVSGAEQKQTYHLSCYTNRDSFIFLGFSDYKKSIVESDHLYSHTINYILDKQTGKLYIPEFENSMFGIGPESEGKVLCGAKINGIYGMYYFSIENELLKIELIADYNTIPIEYSGLSSSIDVDRYGNILLGSLLITKVGKIKKVPTALYLCINGVYYNSSDSSTISHWIDGNGEYVSAEYIPETFVSSMNRPAIYTEGQSPYLLNSTSEDLEIYRWDSDYDWTNQIEFLTIGKVSFTDDSKFRYNYEIVASRPHIYKNICPSYYFNKKGKILYISEDLSIVTFLDVMSGVYTDIISLNDVLRVKSIEKDKYDNVVISYVDNELRIINYYIDVDGNYSTTFKEPEYMIKYLAPIN